MPTGSGPSDPRFFIQYTMLLIQLTIAVTSGSPQFTPNQLIQINQMLDIIMFPSLPGTTPLTRPTNDIVANWITQVYNPIGLEMIIF